MRTCLILHGDDDIDREVTTRWLASFSDLAGVIELTESRGRKTARIKREMKRVGPLRFLDVLAFRVFYKAVLSKKDALWTSGTVKELAEKFALPTNIRKLSTDSPNSSEAEAFLKELQPDIVIARCKTILAKRIFQIPRTGTFVFHPGICPEYRNAHGCFWALAERDYGKVGLTLLKIDEGVDTGPVFGFYSYDYDPLEESHYVIQNRVFIENLRGLRTKLEEIFAGNARPVDVDGRASNTWGQPWLTKYFRIKSDARGRKRETASAKV